MKLISAIYTTLIAMGLACPQLAEASVVVEASPALLLSGQMAVRGEYVAKSGRGFGLDVSSSMGLGSSDYTSVQAMLLMSPNSFRGVFFGAGLAHVQQSTTETASRPSITYFRPDDGRSYDQWQNEVSRLGLTQALGYRLNLAKNFTSSVRVTLDERLHETASVKNEQVSAMSDAPDARNLDPVIWRFALHVGFLLP